LVHFAARWQATEEIVNSKTLAQARRARTTIDRSFDPQAVRRLEADLVDEFLMVVCPAHASGPNWR
jgi:hypothetical protein